MSEYGNYRTKTFNDIYDSVETFLDDYNSVGIPAKIGSDSASTLYYLLYARYGNSSIINSDENQFKYKLFSIIFQYGPAWEKKLEIQDKLIALSDDELTKGTTAIHNSALNPGTEPSTQSLEELEYINSQNTTKYKKSTIEGYSNLLLLLENDVTEDFLKKFSRLFINILEPREPLWYETEIEEI